MATLALTPPPPHVEFSINDASSSHSEQLRARMAVLISLPPFRQAVGGDSSTHAESLQVTQIQGGITNRLYCVSLSGSTAVDTKPVLVRVYGEGSDLFIDRRMDEAVFRELTVYPSGTFGVKLLATLKDGRIEEFFDGCRTLEPHDMAMPELSAVIAATLCEMHHLDVRTCKGENGEKRPVLLEKLRQWYHTASTVTFEEDISKQEQLDALNLIRIGQEIEQTLDQQVASKISSPVVFCHNDLLAGNILVRGESVENNNEQREIVFVDVEYSNYNYRGFDIGNHFCEFSGFDYDMFEEKWPSKNQQYLFLHAYLEKEKELIGDESTDSVDDLYAEVNQYALGSHLFWGLWAIIQARHSPINFDYLKYAKGRFTAYFIAKELVEKEFWD